MILKGITDTQKKKYSALIPNLQWMCILAALCVMFSKFLTSRITMSYFTIIIVTTNRSARHNCSIHQSQAALTRLFFSSELFLTELLQRRHNQWEAFTPPMLLDRPCRPSFFCISQTGPWKFFGLKERVYWTQLGTAWHAVAMLVALWI